MRLDLCDADECSGIRFRPGRYYDHAGVWTCDISDPVRGGDVCREPDEKWRRGMRKIGGFLAFLMGMLSILKGLSANGWIPGIHPWLW